MSEKGFYPYISNDQKKVQDFLKKVTPKVMQISQKHPYQINAKIIIRPKSKYSSCFAITKEIF